jgi:hypothetical protein
MRKGYYLPSCVYRCLNCRNMLRYAAVYTFGFHPKFLMSPINQMNFIQKE